jgi:hypothetical protein
VRNDANKILHIELGFAGGKRYSGMTMYPRDETRINQKEYPPTHDEVKIQATGVIGGEQRNTMKGTRLPKGRERGKGKR